MGNTFAKCSGNYAFDCGKCSGKGEFEAGWGEKKDADNEVEIEEEENPKTDRE